MKNDYFKRCPICGKSIPLRSPRVERGDEYWCKGHTPPKRKRGRPRKSISGLAPWRLGEKTKDAPLPVLRCADCGKEVGTMTLIHNHAYYCKGRPRNAER